VVAEDVAEDLKYCLEKVLWFNCLNKEPTKTKCDSTYNGSSLYIEKFTDVKLFFDEYKDDSLAATRVRTRFSKYQVNCISVESNDLTKWPLG
jgi:hypothetical protein